MKTKTTRNAGGELRGTTSTMPAVRKENLPARRRRDVAKRENAKRKRNVAKKENARKRKDAVRRRSAREKGDVLLLLSLKLKKRLRKLKKKLRLKLKSPRSKFLLLKSALLS